LTKLEWKLAKRREEKRVSFDANIATGDRYMATSRRE